MYALIAAIIYFMGGFFSGENVTRAMKVEMTLQANQSVYALGIETPTPLNFGGIGESSFQTPTPFFTSTPYPTYTPYPTMTPLVDWLRGTPYPTQNSFSPSQVNWVFSYYYPDLVQENPDLYAANCHPDNVIYNKFGKVTGCKNTTASGLGWKEFIFDETNNMSIRGGVAVSYYPDSNSLMYPFGSTIRVTSPAIMAGDYLVVDICPACDDYYQSHGVIFLDFIMRGLPQGVNFWDKITVESVTYP